VFFLEDCDSENGTRIDSQRLESGRKYELLSGDKIFIDDQLIEVSIPTWEELMRLDEEEVTEEFAFHVLPTTAPVAGLPVDKSERPATTAEHSEGKVSPDNIKVAAGAEDGQSDVGGYDCSLVSSFLAGIHLDAGDLKLQPDGYRELFGEMGLALFHAVDGVRRALNTHDSFRNQYRIPGTMWSRSQLNPLYNTKIDTQEVMKILLTSRSDAIAGPVEAIREATGDFYLHGIAVPTAVHEAVRSILETFNWRILEKEFESTPGFAGFGPLKKARFWELYCQEFDRQKKTLDEVDSSFHRVVAKAYSRARERELVNGATEKNPDAE